MEISAQKTKLMASSTKPSERKITARRQELETVKQFKYISEEVSKTEVLARAAQTAATTAKLKPIWRDKNIALKAKLKLLDPQNTGPLHLPACMRAMDLDSTTAKEDPSSGNEMLQKNPWHLLH